MSDIIIAKNLLLGENYTCVLCKGENLYTSQSRGVKPLVKWLKSETDFSGYSAADKVVGKATAFLYVLLGVKSVYAHVLSEGAKVVFKQYGIDFEFETLVPNIINRKGDGICPFESAVLEIKNADEAYTVIKNKMQEMNIEINQ